jgi:hypothetical protein
VFRTFPPDILLPGAKVSQDVKPRFKESG